MSLITHDTKDAAQFLSIAEITLRNSRATGLLCGIGAPKFRKLGRKVIYFESDLIAWLDALPAYQNTTESNLRIEGAK